MDLDQKDDGYRRTRRDKPKDTVFAFPVTIKDEGDPHDWTMKYDQRP